MTAADRGRGVTPVLSLALLLGALSSGCAGHGRRQLPSYVVRPGDTVYSIAVHHGLDYHDLARWNGLSSDYLITPGERLWLSAPRGARPSAATSPAPAATVPPLPEGPPVVWSWPAQGQVLGRVLQPEGGRGLDIEGSAGEEIRAAADGRVVYSGTGLRAYGVLVIIKHNERFLSAYGHNQTVLVHEGDAVRAGQPIATMGQGANGRPALYFEIRDLGVPVDPLKFLPVHP